MLPIEEVPELTIWFFAPMCTSILLLIYMIIFIFKNPTHQTTVEYGPLISTIAAITPTAAFIFFNNPNVVYNILYIFYGFQLSFDFLAIIYAFQCLLEQKRGLVKVLVFIGYAWIPAAIGALLILTTTLKNDGVKSSYDNLNCVYNIRSFSLLAIWGLIFIILSLSFLNKKQLGAKGLESMTLYILLVSITAISTAMLIYVPISSFRVLDAATFMFIDIPTKVSIAISIHLNSIWNKKASSNRRSVTMKAKYHSLEDKQYNIV